MKTAQYVINETDEPIYACWNGGTIIWDPQPKPGKPAKCYVLKQETGMVDRGEFLVGDKLKKLRPGCGVTGPEVLVEATPEEKSIPTWRHVCDPDFVHAMRTTNIYDKKSPVKKLTFVDTITDRYDQAVVEKTVQLSQAEAALAQRQKELAELEKKIALTLEKQKVLEAKR